MVFFRSAAALLAVFLFFSACRKDVDPVVPVDKHAQSTGTIPPADTTSTDTTATDTVPSGTSRVVFRFTPIALHTTVSASPAEYSNGLGDEFTITKFNYYISNVRLYTNSGAVIIEPDSYHLVRHLEGASSFTITNLPAGYYTKAEFLIGVDSLRNVSGAQSGALDPAWDMFWDWNTGYIFYKLEGSYTSLSGASGDYAFHIGGFQGADNCLQAVTLDLGSVRADAKTYHVVDVDADAAAIFDKPVQMSFDDYFSQQPSPKTFRTQAQNYADMFTVRSVSLHKK